MQQIGRYQVLEEIARGGMGVVFRALDPALGREVAIKVLLSPDPDPRLHQEIRSLERLQHPGIVAFYEIAQDHAGRDCVVMEFVDGESLHALIKRDGPLPVDRALDVIEELARALAYAHARGVLHRDLKPHNVLIARDGRVKLADFGLGKVVDQTLEASRVSLTKTGEIMGTPAYMPPEQATGDKSRMGPASDVYSLGATLFALLTGRPPFTAETTINLIYAVLEQDPAAPSTYRPEVPPEVDALVLRCLAKDPADRYPSAAEVVARLEGHAAPESPAPRGSATSLKRSSLVAAALALLGLAAALLVVAASRGAGDAPSGVLPATSQAKTPAQAQAQASAPRPGQLEAAHAAKQRGLQAYDAGRYDEAIAAFDEAIRLDPDYALAYASRGHAQQALGDWRGATEDFGEAIRLRPDDPLAYHSRGVTRAYLGDVEGALRDYDEAIHLRPDYALAYSNRGHARSLLGDWEGATDDFNEAIRLNPDLGVAYHSRGLARWRQGDRQGAVADQTQAIRLEPKLAKAYVARSAAHAGLGDLQAALEDCNQAIRLDPDSAHVYANRGVVHGELGDWKRAEEDYSAVLRLNPDDADAHANRATARMQLGDWEGAIEDWTALLRVEPDDIRSYYNRATARERLNDWRGAVEDYAAAARLQPGDARPHYSRGFACGRLGDWQGAIESWERALELEPDAAWAAEARGNIRLARQELAGE